MRLSLCTRCDPKYMHTAPSCLPYNLPLAYHTASALPPTHRAQPTPTKAMPFAPRAAEPYTPMTDLSTFQVPSAERICKYILHMAREQSTRPSWYRPNPNGKFYIQHFKHAGGSAYIARASAYQHSSDGGFDKYCIVLATGLSKKGVLGALESLEEVSERREREYEGEIEDLLEKAAIEN